MDEEDIENIPLLKFLVNEFTWWEDRKEYYAQFFDKDTKSCMLFTLKPDGEFIYAFIDDIKNTKGCGTFHLSMPKSDNTKEWDW